MTVPNKGKFLKNLRTNYSKGSAVECTFFFFQLFVFLLFVCLFVFSCKNVGCRCLQMLNIHIRIENPFRHLRWSFLQKVLTAFKCELFFTKSTILELQLTSQYASDILPKKLFCIVCFYFHFEFNFYFEFLFIYSSFADFRIGSCIQCVRKILRKSYIFYSPDTHTYVCISGDKKYKFFQNFADVLNESSL